MNPTIKAKKYVLVVGIASAALFAAMSVFCLFLDGAWPAALFFIPFTMLGLILTALYYRQKIVFNDNCADIYSVLKRKRTVLYKDIDYFIIN